MLCNKKGDWESFRNIIILLLIAAILIPLTSIILNSGEKSAEITACRSFIVFQSAAKYPALGIKIKDFTNHCVTFSDKLKGNKYEVYETLAKSMYDVWSMYGEGKIDFFSDWDWGKKNTYCFIGDEIKIDEELKTDELDLDEFEEYLSDNYLPKKDITYAEFLTGAKNIKMDFGSGNIDLKNNKKIYILFTVKKAGLWSLGKTVKMDILGCAVGGGIGFAVGTPIPLIGNIILAGKGCILGMSVSEGIHLTSVAGQAEELFPGLIMVSDNDLSSLQKKCDGGLHYNPK